MKSIETEKWSSQLTEDRRKMYETGMENLFESWGQCISFVSVYTVLAECGKCSLGSMQCGDPIACGLCHSLSGKYFDAFL